MNYLGGVRLGRLLEDMDIFAVHLGRWKFTQQADYSGQPMYLSTQLC